MPRIESIRIWRFIHVSFSLNDWGEINDVATGWTQYHAANRCYREARRTNREESMKKKPTPKVNLAVRMPPELHERLVAEAEDREVSANWMMNRAIEEFLDRLIPTDELRWTRD